MKINWILPVNHKNYNKMPASVWIRCYQLIPHFEKAGFSSVINHDPCVADVNVFVRRQDDAALGMAVAARQAGVKNIFDLCVNYLDTSGELGKGYGALPDQKIEAEKMIDNSDAIFCASENIKEALLGRHNKLLCLPDSIDFDYFKFKKNENDFIEKKKITIGFAGVSSKTNYLFSKLYDLIKKYGLNLMIVAEKRPTLLKKYKFVRWRYKNFPKDLLSFDVGISPREINNTYDRGHSAFKINSYLAQGIPVLASPVPSYLPILSDGQAGRICANIEEWKDSLFKISTDRSLLVEWSKNCIKKVHPYSTSVVASQYVQAFNEIG